MTTKILALAGVALMVLASGAEARAVSNRAEEAQTRALNQQQSQMAPQPAAATPITETPVTDMAASLPANAPPAAAPTMMAQAAALPAPGVVSAQSSPGATVSLDKLNGVPNEIASAKVVDETGKVLGAVQRIGFGAGNAPLKVDVVLIGTNVIVTVDASRVNYDPARNVIVARASDGAMDQLAQAK